MGRFMDVSLEIFPGMVVWPGDPAVEINRISEIGAVHHANVSEMRCGVHTGTHVDAPFHFLPDGKTVEKLDVQALVGPAFVAELLSAQTIDSVLLESANIPEGTERLLLHTRNSDGWLPDPKEFHSDYVGLDASGAEWVARRHIRLVGVDYLSVATRAQTKPVHDTLLGKEIVIVEGLNLSAVPAGACRLYCLPLKLRGSDGAPARVLLEVD
jgi:arylformamidase